MRQRVNTVGECPNRETRQATDAVRLNINSNTVVLGPVVAAGAFGAVYFILKRQ